MGDKQKELSTFVSAVCTRMIHVFITVGIASVLLTRPTVLRQALNEQNFLQPVLFIVTAVMSLALYFMVSFMDPGYVKRGDPDVKEIKLIVDDEEDEDISIYEVKKMNFHDWKIDMSKSNNSEKMRILSGDSEKKTSPVQCFNLEPDERCGLCGLQRPMRAKHCRECKHCVRRFDHHCPWIFNCVGERNHKWFYTFLVTEMALLGWGFYISITGYEIGDNSNSWVSHNILLVLVDIFIVVLFLVVGSLVCIHTYLILQNHTTWETMSRTRITYLKGVRGGNPFNLGVCRNIFTFFCYFKPYDWTVVYSKSSTSFSGSNGSCDDSGVDSDEQEFCEITIDDA
ncbi:palmitoyltransferase ZDHHC12-B-like [Clavelina lepadiformis]|uniref:palmitoyltransferase ZDHHC12-B-like n=1 Tax=Clavelina lepadiformis TaxID=159417 RepID=UPI00404236B6